MWTVTVLIRGGGTINFIYEAEDRARGSYEALRECRAAGTLRLELQDDFGARSDVDIAAIGALTLQDVKRVNAGAGELQLAQARANVALQNKAKHDPTLNLAQPGAGGFRM